MKNKGRLILSIFVAFGLLLAQTTHAALYNANGILGQYPSGTANYTTRDDDNGSTVNSTGLDYPDDVAIDKANNRIFVSDNANNRVLVFTLNSSNKLSSEVAANVLGQANFTSEASGSSASRLKDPRGLLYDSENQLLFVADYGNYRAVIFDVASITNGEDAVKVLGQPDLTTFTNPCPFGCTYSSTTLLPQDFALDSTNDRLFVAETGNRLVVYNVSTITNGEAAVNVLGQSSFTGKDAATTQAGMNLPGAVAYDSVNDRLFVSEIGNSRVTAFDVASITNGENATAVLGQTLFTTSATGATQSAMNQPYGLEYSTSTEQLIVSDTYNHRISFFDVASITNGENAVANLGQSNWTNATSATTQTGYNYLEGLTLDPVNRTLFIADSDNSRVLQLSLVHITSASLDNGTASSAYSDTVAAENTQGTLGFTLASGTLPAGLSLGATTGTISGTPTTAGTYTFSIQANDTFSTGDISDRKSYSVTIAAGAASTAADGGRIFSEDPTNLPWYVPPRMQTIYSDGTIVYHDGSGASTPTTTPPITVTPSPITPSVSKITFSHNLRYGMTDPNVKVLQMVLNMLGFKLADSGPGSRGQETEYFGSLTKQALIRFQEAHTAQILTPLNLTKGTGILGPSTRAYFSTLSLPE